MSILKLSNCNADPVLERKRESELNATGWHDVQHQVVLEGKREYAAWRQSRKEKEGQRLTAFFAACLLSGHLSGIREY